jgi:cell division protein FtsB
VAPRRTSTFTSRALVLLLVVAVLGVSYASSIRAWLNQRSEHNALAAQIAQQQAAIAGLRNAEQRWQDPAYVETMARLRFGWVMPGEKTYRVIGKDGKVLGVGNAALSDPAIGSRPTSPPWWAGAAGSLQRADAVPVVAPTSRPPARHPATLIGPTPGSSTKR